MTAYTAAPGPNNTWRVTAPPMDPADTEPTSAADCRITVRKAEQIVAEAPGSLNIEGLPRGNRPTSRPFQIVPPQFEGKSHVVGLPAKPDQVVFGGGGRFVVANIPDKQVIAVVDVCRAQIVKYISVKGRALCAAGSHKLIIVLPDQRRLERWDLATFEREQTAPIGPNLDIHDAAMGSASDGPVLLVSGTRQPKPKFALLMVDINRLVEVPMAGLKGEAWKIDSGEFALRASSDGRTFTGHRPHHEPHPVYVLRLEPKAMTSIVLKDLSLVPSADGSLLFSPMAIYDAQGAAIKRVVSGRFSTAENAAYFLHTEGDKVAFCLTTTRQVVGTANIGGWSQHSYVPRADLVVSMGSHFAQINLWRVDLAEQIQKSEGNVLFIESVPPRSVRRNQPFAYQLSARSKSGMVRYALVDGPKGMTISDTGLLEWTAPGYATPPADVTVSATDSSGQTVKQTFTVLVE